MKLHFRQYGESVVTRPPAILLHGLFGSLVNWHRIAGELANDRWIIVPDLRNHGRSPHAEDVSYPAMAEDIRQMMDRLEISSADLVGHSMGAKLAMWVALTQNARVQRLVSVDMAPVQYPNRFGVILDRLRSLSLAEIGSRKEADEMLSGKIEPKAVRDYLLQNLFREDQCWRWRNNLDALHQGMDSIMGFPLTNESQPFNGPAHFIYGSESDYVLPEYRDRISQLFPKAEMHRVNGAGHWVYSEKPAEFIQLVKSVLSRS